MGASEHKDTKILMSSNTSYLTTHTHTLSPPVSQESQGLRISFLDPANRKV